MKSRKRVVILGFLVISFIIGGCAGTIKVLKQEDIRDIRKLAIVTSLLDKELKVLDHTGIESYGDPRFGFPVFFLDVLLTAFSAAAAKYDSLGGDPDPLRQELVDFPIKKVFDENFTKFFSKNFEIISPQDVDNLGIAEYPEKESVDGETIRDYTVLKEKLGVDTVLEINFIYGLAAYAEHSASTVVSADISVISIVENRILTKKTILSDSYYKSGHTVDEFKANGAELFKKEIPEAIRGVAHLVASGFGVALSLKEKSYWHSEK